MSKIAFFAIIFVLKVLIAIFRWGMSQYISKTRPLVYVSIYTKTDMITTQNEFLIQLVENRFNAKNRFPGTGTSAVHLATTSWQLPNRENGIASGLVNRKELWQLQVLSNPNKQGFVNPIPHNIRISHKITRQRRKICNQTLSVTFPQQQNVRDLPTPQHLP